MARQIVESFPDIPSPITLDPSKKAMALKRTEFGEVLLDASGVYNEIKINTVLYVITYSLIFDNILSCSLKHQQQLLHVWIPLDIRRIVMCD